MSSGTTFAAMARAAARADHDMKTAEDATNIMQYANQSPVGKEKSGVVKLKPSNRRKGSKTWQKVDLGEFLGQAGEQVESDDQSAYDSGPSGPSFYERKRTVIDPQSGFARPSTAHSRDAEPTEEDSQRAVAFQAHNRDIVRVFGCALPSLDLLQRNFGQYDGEMQFVIHTNGDVSAHQWNSRLHQWTNVGQFSFARKKVEGQLAAERLRGQTVGSMVPHNTLGYFLAIARQRESLTAEVSAPRQVIKGSSASAPLMEDILKFAPTGPRQRPPPASRFDSFSSAGITPVESITQNVANLQMHDGRDSSGGRYPQPAVDPRQQTVFHTPQDDPFVSARTSPEQARREQPHSQAHSQPQHDVRQLSGQDPRIINPSIRFPQTETQLHAPLRDDQADLERARILYAEQERQRWEIHQQQANLREVAFGDGAANTRRGPAASPFCPQVQRNVYQGSQQQSQDRSQAAPPTLFNHTRSNALHTRALQTALNDSREQMPVAPSTTRGVAGTRLFDQEAYPDRTIHAPSPELSRKALEDSLADPDLGRYCWDIYDGPSTQNMSNEELLAHQEKTAWNERMPSFADKRRVIERGGRKITQEAALTREQEEELWWTSGTRADRHNAFYESIMSAHKNAPGKHYAGLDADSVNPITTRLLIPLFETLNEYVNPPGPTSSSRSASFAAAGPPNSQSFADNGGYIPAPPGLSKINKNSYSGNGNDRDRFNIPGMPLPADYFAKYAAPPEYAIDKSARGNESFFGENWGAPPQRIGRDPRYRAFVEEERGAGDRNRRSSGVDMSRGGGYRARGGGVGLGSTGGGAVSVALPRVALPSVGGWSNAGAAGGRFGDVGGGRFGDPGAAAGAGGGNAGQGWENRY